MLPAATDRILALPDDALVLDVGGWAAPFNRADWVIDAMPFETRGQMGFSYGGERERFGADTWARRDICAREPWPFADDQFDFVLCVTTLEDVRDPIWVCQEMSRVAKAGYAEVPSVLGELVWRLPGEGRYLGNRHHHWICDVREAHDASPASIVFTHKQHSIHADPALRIGPGMVDELTVAEHLQGVFWEGELHAEERLLIGETLHAELAAAVARRFPPSAVERAARAAQRRVRGRGRQAADPMARAAGSAARRARGGTVAADVALDERHVRPGLGLPRDA